MAGGAGTRLWPMSRAARPKQLLEVVGGRSLLQLAFDRLRAVLPAEAILVCTAEAHREAVLANLPDLPPENVIGEPCGRDTANAVGLPAAVLHRRDPDAVLAVVSADQVIEPVEVFADRLTAAFGLAEDHKNALVTLGIVPTAPHTGFGYIERGDELGGGAYRVSAYRPESYAGLTLIADAWSGPRREAVLAATYPALPKISIDYAVMEPAAQGHGSAEVLVVELGVDWLDIGSWPALASALAPDAAGNMVQAATALVDSVGNIVISDDPEHLVAVVGLRDMVVVHTRDVTMICPKRDAERVRQLVAAARQRYGERYL